MRYCPICLSELPDNVAFCPNCVKQNNVEEQSPPNVIEEPPVQGEGNSTIINNTRTAVRIKKREKNKLGLFTIIAILAVSLAVIGIMHSSRKTLKAPAISAGDNGNESEEVWDVEMATDSVLYLEVYDAEDNLVATASGFVYSDRLKIITNFHAIEGAHHVRAYTKNPVLAQSDHTTISKFFLINTVLAYNEETDLAILRCDEDMGISPIPAGDSNSAKQGDTVYAVGYPLGVANTLSNGIISARYSLEEVDLIQVSAPISSGSSGGALLDAYGNAIGVICASYIDGQNLNLAIPISYVDELLISATSMGTSIGDI